MLYEVITADRRLRLAEKFLVLQHGDPQHLSERLQDLDLWPFKGSVPKTDLDNGPVYPDELHVVLRDLLDDLPLDLLVELVADLEMCPEFLDEKTLGGGYIPIS